MTDKATRAINGWLDELIAAEPSPWLRLYFQLGRPYIVWLVKRSTGRLIEEYVDRMSRPVILNEGETWPAA